MATGTLTSVEEYLRTVYRPDCDYVDGEILDRNLGEREHASTQGEILFYLKSTYPRFRRRVLPEQRVRVKPSRFRIPDVCVLAEHGPFEKVILTPPLLCIEVLSSEDTLTRTLRRAQDYFEMGVPTCWIIDPVERIAWIATSGQLVEAGDGILRSADFEMPLSEVLE